MGKGKATREMILGKAAALFNSRGYFGASMSDVMNATGLEKGGIYNHFPSKDQLALEAFDFAFEQGSQLFRSRLDLHEKSIEKLIAFVDCFKYIASNPPVPGGCPLLNSAVESDDGHPEMKVRVMSAMDVVIGSVQRLIERAIAEGDLKPPADPHEMATTIVAALEGGIMLTRLYSDDTYMESVSSSVHNQINALRIER